jgi:SPP1 family predicted phage head-tail adaptor
MTQPGDLKRRIYLQQPSLAKNVYGEEAITWVTYATVWAQIEPLSGRELLLAQQVNSEISARITIRYNNHIATSHRISYGTATYAVNTIIDKDLNHNYLELLCTQAT